MKEIPNLLKVSKVFPLLLCLLFTPAVLAQSEEETEKPKYKRQIIVAVTGGRVRTGPSTDKQIIREYDIGSKFSVLNEKNGWSEVVLEEAGENTEAKVGWISNTITETYDSNRPGVQFQKIAAKYLSRKSLSFGAAKQLFYHLPKAADAAKTYEVGGDLRLKSLEALSKALKKVPINKSESSPYKEFLAKHKDDVVYSEPAGEWYVKAQKFWELHARYRQHKVAQKIAWRAAANPLPGECEGYINCYLYLLRATQGEYLNFYPGGTYSKQAIMNMRGMLQPIVADARTKASYYTTNDVSDRAEFNKMLAELRKIVSRSPHVEKQTVLNQIVAIAEGYR